MLLLSWWQGRTERTLEIRSDKKSKHDAGGSVNTVDFSAVPATLPQRKGSSSKRVQINEPPDSSGTMNENDDKVPQGGVSIRPARLFDDDLLDLSPEEKELVAYFELGGEVSQRIQHPTAIAKTVTDDLDVEQLRDELEVEQVDMTMEDEVNISDVEDGDEADGVENLDDSNRRKSKRLEKAKRLKEIQKRASEAKKRQQQSLGDGFASAGDATPTSLGRAVAKVGRAASKVVSETRATSMEEEPTDCQWPDLEASNAMDVSLYQGQVAPVVTIYKNTTLPRKFPLPWEEEPMKDVHVHHSTASVTPSKNATAASTISTMTSSTLKQTKYAGVPNEMPTVNEGRDIFENETTEGNGPGKWLLNWNFEKVPGQRVADQLLPALGPTVKLSAASVKGFKLHPHDHNPNLPEVTSDKPEGNFPLTGGACQQYVHFPMEWQLAAAKAKTFRPPKAASEHRYDDEAGEYNGPERVSGVIVVSADGDVKKMVQRMRLDLEGTGIAIW